MFVKKSVENGHILTEDKVWPVMKCVVYYYFLADKRTEEVLSIFILCPTTFPALLILKYYSQLQFIHFSAGGEHIKHKETQI